MYFLKVSSCSRNLLVYFLNPLTHLDLNTVPGRGTLKLDQVVVGAVRGEERAGLLERSTYAWSRPGAPSGAP